ncbi:MAG TPA: DUF1629 domain-containing protein, partial [Burkholderiaceae bacterium]
FGSWIAPQLEQYLGNGRKKRKPAPIGDAPRSAMVNLISHRAVNALNDIFERDANLYPVRLADSSDLYYMVVAKHLIDCLDRRNSRGHIQEFGTKAGLFTSLADWVFDEGALGEHDIFFLPDSATTLYVTERFKQRVVEAGLKGFCFRASGTEGEDPFVS